MNKKLLIVEDEKHLAVGLQTNFELQGYQVTVAEDGPRGLALFEKWKPDIIILDLMLPGIDGLEVLSQIRKTDPFLPILVLSAKNEDENRVLCLANGSDDFLAKPFNLDELVLRVKRLMKWTESSRNKRRATTFELGPYKINLHNGSVTGRGKKFDLTEQELKLFQVFVDNEAEVLSREELLRSAWGYSKGVETRTVDNFIVRLRKYFEPDPNNPKLFMNKRNRGYLFKSSETHEN